MMRAPWSDCCFSQVRIAPSVLSLIGRHDYIVGPGGMRLIEAGEILCDFDLQRRI